jgi:uncharacterized protein (DUF488 family)
MGDRETSRTSLFTIGHSDHELDHFLSLLRAHAIDAVADVRSHPYSRFHEQFNREGFASALKRAGIKYVFLGDELGARRIERESYVEKQARYELISKLPAFHEGLRRLRQGLAAHRVSLLCAEKDPITCHRMVLVCRPLRREAIDIQHILADGALETTEQAEMRLLDEVGLPQEDLFSTRAELIERAYDLQAERIAYVEPETPSAIAGGMP